MIYTIVCFFKIGKEYKPWFINFAEVGQILEKPCVPSRGHIFSPIIMKLGQNVCFDEISDEVENGSHWSKTRSLGQVLELYMH